MQGGRKTCTNYGVAASVSAEYQGYLRGLDEWRMAEGAEHGRTGYASYISYVSYV